MRTCTLLAWGFIATLALGLTGPVRADREKDNDRPERGRTKITITIRGDNDQDELQAYQQWYSWQLRDYDDIDRETGERFADLIQLVTEVNAGRLVVSGRQHVPHAVQLTGRTQVTFTNSRRYASTPSWWSRRFPPRGTSAPQQQIRMGDLVVVQGYLGASGNLVATTLRVVGHAHGWGDDDDYYDTPVSTYGQRAWGEVRTVNSRYGTLDVRTSQGYRTIRLTRDGVFLANDQPQPLSFLRPGDRVVYYFRGNNNTTIDAYRVVLLRQTDPYPEMDRPSYTDPGYLPPKSTGRPNTKDPQPEVRRNGVCLEGALKKIYAGLIFNSFVIVADTGKETNFRYTKALPVFDRNGDKATLTSLYENQRIRVYYSEAGGSLIAERVEAL